MLAEKGGEGEKVRIGGDRGEWGKGIGQIGKRNNGERGKSGWE